MKNKINEERVLELFDQGLSQQKIADELGTSKGGVNNILKKYGKTRSMNDIKIDVEQVLMLHSEGLSNPEIAEIIGHARSKVYDIIIANNLVGNKAEIDRSEFKIYNPTKEQLIIDISKNTIKQIADINGTSSVSVWKRMRDHNVKSPRCKKN